MTKASPPSPLSPDRRSDRRADPATKAYIDGTFGAGGYTRAILEAADCRVWAVDRIPVLSAVLPLWSMNTLVA